jgi:hypothetical protein
VEPQRHPVRRECGEIHFEYLGGRMISGWVERSIGNRV